MITKTIRKIVKIDAAKCNGCGACANKCAEGALQIIDGKARLVSDVYCDGLGACLGECPEGAITIEEREAAEFSDEAVHEHLREGEAEPACGCPSARVTEFKAHQHAPEVHEGTLPCGCPGSQVQNIERENHPEIEEHIAHESELTHWPVQLTLVPPNAPFLKRADILLAAHCVPFAYAGFHEELLRDHALLIACPKLDDYQAHLAKLTQVLRQAQPRSLTVVHMEVPCCSGLAHMAHQAIQSSGIDIPLNEVVVSVRGKVLEEV